MPDSPFTLAQQQVLDGLDRGVEAHRFLIQASISLGEKIDPEKLAAAFESLFGNHPELLNGFKRDGDAWSLLPGDSVQVPIREIDWTSTPPHELGTEWARIQEEEINAPIDLSAPPLFRLVLITLPDSTTHFLWTFHEAILSPEQAFERFCELLLYYDGLVPGESSPEGDVEPEERPDTIWFHKQFEFSGEAPGTIPQIYETPASSQSRIGMITRRLPDALAEAIATTANATGVGNSTIVSGAWALVLSRLNAAEKISLTQIRTSEREGRARVPTRIVVDDSATIAEWLKLLPSEQELRALTASDLIEESRNAVWENAITVSGETLDPDIGTYLPRWMRAEFKLQRLPAGQFLLEFSQRGKERADLRLSYDGAATREEDAERVFEAFVAALEGITQQTDRKVADLDLLSAKETRAILAAGNFPAASLPSDERIEERFARMAEETPEAPATGMGDEVLSYQELNEYSAQLGDHLQGLLSKERPRLGICMTTTPWLPVAILAALRCKHGVAMIDPRWPAALIESLLEETRCAALLCDSESSTVFPADSKVRKVIIDAEWDTISSSPKKRAEDVPTSDEAFQIFNDPESLESSRAAFSHASLLQAADFWADSLDDETPQRLLLSESLATIPGLETLLAAICSGRRAVLADAEALENPSALQRLLHDEEITALFMQQEDWRSLNDYLRRARLSMPGKITRISVWRSPSEPLGMKDFSVLRNASLSLTLACRAETASATGLAATFRHDQLDDVLRTYGRPTPTSQAFLVDARGSIVPFHAVGELVLAGACLATELDPTAKDAIQFDEQETPEGKIRRIRCAFHARLTPDGEVAAPAPPSDSSPEFRVTDATVEAESDPPAIPDADASQPVSDPEQPGLFEEPEHDDILIRLSGESPNIHRNILFLVPPAHEAGDLSELVGHLAEKAHSFAIELAGIPASGSARTLAGVASGVLRQLESTEIRFDHVIGIGRAGCVAQALSRRPNRLSTATFSLLDATPPPGKGMWAKFQNAFGKMQSHEPQTRQGSLDELLQTARAEPTDARIHIFVRSESHANNWKDSAPNGSLTPLPAALPTIFHDEYASATSQLLIDKLHL